LLVHIGLPKTASTYLQANLFPQLLAASGYPCTPYHKEHRAMAMLRRALTDPEQLCEQRILSNEHLAASIHPKQPGESWGNFQEFLTCAAPLTPQPRVLFMVREHQSWLWSSYLQRYKRRKVNEPFVRFVTRFSLADLSWAERIDQLRAHFEHVLVLDQQAFRTVQTATLQQIADFAELPLTASQLEQIQATAGRSNPSPQTQLALQAHRLLVSNRPLWQLCKHLSWGRIQYREQLSAPLNRLGGERLTAPELPPALKVALAEDWAATGERLRMYRKETDRGS
jgi:hypothetical protein